MILVFRFSEVNSTSVVVMFGHSRDRLHRPVDLVRCFRVTLNTFSNSLVLTSYLGFTSG